jgi:hypothetical protein
MEQQERPAGAAAKDFEIDVAHGNRLVLMRVRHRSPSMIGESRAAVRYHTATHVLTGAMFNDFDVRVTGNQLTPEKGRVDFAFTEFDREVLEEGFRRANALVGQNLDLRISFVSAAEAHARPELFKLETAFPRDLISGAEARGDRRLRHASRRRVSRRRAE